MNCLNCGCLTDNPKFCSSSCSASFNNKGVRRHGTARECLNCSVKIDRGKFCSLKCQGERTRKIICEEIEDDKIVFWGQIKRYLLEKSPVCSECGIDSWRGKAISLECDHIDGDRSNNRLSNARLLCPNCHSQTETFRFRNASNPKGKEHRRKRFLKNLKDVNGPIV